MTKVGLNVALHSTEGVNGCDSTDTDSVDLIYSCQKHL